MSIEHGCPLVDREKARQIFMDCIYESSQRAEHQPERYGNGRGKNRIARRRELDAFQLGLEHATEAFLQAVGDKPRESIPLRLP